MHSMRWSKVLRPRSEKGLGLGCLRLKNWACYLNAGGSLRMQVTIQKKKKSLRRKEVWWRRLLCLSMVRISGCRPFH